MVTGSYLKVLRALMYQGKQPRMGTKSHSLTEKHIIHLQQAICGVLKTERFIDIWTPDLQLRSENQSCLTGWDLQAMNTVKDTTEKT